MAGFCMKYHVSCAYGRFHEKSAEPSVYSSYFLERDRWWNLDIHATKAYSNDCKCIPNSLSFVWQSFLFRGTGFVNVWIMGIFPTFVSWSHNVWVSQHSCLVCIIRARNVWSAKQHRDPCSGPPADSTNYPNCISNFPSTWLANGQWLF